MKALLLTAFGQAPAVTEVPDLAPPDGGVVVAVSTTGLCRSDWHAFAGHDPDVTLPHVPGHEFAGTVSRVGAGVAGVRIGDRVTAPFVLACGDCEQCRAGQQQVCRNQVQPGFTRWGSFAEEVIVERAAVNLIALPDDVDLAVAAILGCRFATAFRALLAVGRLRPQEWVAVHGCGGVGLSAIMIATATGARVVATDVDQDALHLARDLGAETTIDTAGRAGQDVAAAIQEATLGGAHLSLDALGSEHTCAASIACLRPRGRHVQIGLLPPALGLPAVPMHLVIAGELEVLGSHGMPAHAYPELLALVASGRLRPGRLLTRTIRLDEAGPALAGMSRTAGVTLIRPDVSL